MFDQHEQTMSNLLIAERPHEAPGCAVSFNKFYGEPQKSWLLNLLRVYIVQIRSWQGAETASTPAR